MLLVTFVTFVTYAYLSYFMIFMIHFHSATPPSLSLYFENQRDRIRHGSDEDRL